MNTEEVVSMDQYERWAEYCISKFVYSPTERKRLLSDTDFVGGMMTALMKADSTHDANREGAMSRRSHRIQHGKYYILKNFYAKRKREKSNWEGLNIHHSFYDKGIDLLEDREYLKTLFDKADLTDTQRKCIELYYFENKTCQEIGELMDFSRQAANQNVTSGLKKLKEAS